MITNNPTRIIRTEVIPGISDHDAVLSKLDISPTKTTQPIREILLYNKAKWESLKSDIDKLNEQIQSDSHCSSVETLWNTFRNGLTDSTKNTSHTKLPTPKHTSLGLPHPSDTSYTNEIEHTELRKSPIPTTLDTTIKA